MEQATQQLVNKLLKDGKQVFVNSKEEIFTDESYAKLAELDYEQITEPYDIGQPTEPEPEELTETKSNEPEPEELTETKSNEPEPEELTETKSKSKAKKQ